MKTKRIGTKVSPEVILSVAEDLFSKKGYRGTSVTDISKRLKVSKAALYYHFKNKMEILKTLYLITVEELVSPFEELMNRDLPVEEKFKILTVNQANVIGKNAKRAKIYFGSYNEFPRKMRKEIKSRRARFNEKWIELYKEGVKAGLFKNIDARIAVYVIVGACNWIQMWYSPNGRLTQSELGGILGDLLSTGYLKRE